MAESERPGTLFNLWHAIIQKCGMPQAMCQTHINAPVSHYTFRTLEAGPESGACFATRIPNARTYVGSA
eukprot:12304509-Heterocapsa_arctica.AAC.1